MTKFESLIEQLKSWQTTTDLHLNKRHRCGDQELQILLPLIMDHPYLKSIAFYHCTITDTGLNEFLDSLARRRRPMTELSFFGLTCFTPLGIYALKKYLGLNLSLENLNLQVEIPEEELYEMIELTHYTFNFQKLTIKTLVSDLFLEKVLSLFETKKLTFEFTNLLSPQLSEHGQSLLEKIRLIAERNRDHKKAHGKSHHKSSEAALVPHQTLLKPSLEDTSTKGMKKLTPREEVKARRARENEEEMKAFLLDQNLLEMPEPAALESDFELSSDNSETDETESSAPPPNHSTVHAETASMPLTTAHHDTFLVAPFVPLEGEKKQYYIDRYQMLTAQVGGDPYVAAIKIMQDYIRFTSASPCDFLRKLRRRMTTDSHSLVEELSALCLSPNSRYKNTALLNYLQRQSNKARKSDHACLTFTLEYLISMIKTAPLPIEQRLASHEHLKPF